MTIKERNREIYKLNLLGVSVKDLSKKYNLKEKQILYIISANKRLYIDEEMFDVYQYDCWLLPTKG
jgi:Mor family transcriptional regulator